jgi:phage tail protein X
LFIAVPVVVPTVSTSVCAVVPLIVTDDEARLQVAAVYPEGMMGPLTAQLRFTVPVNPFDGVTVIVDVLPVVAPGVTVTLPLLLSANEGVAAVVTVTLTGVVAVMLPDVPVTVTT